MEDSKDFGRDECAYLQQLVETPSATEIKLLTACKDNQGTLLLIRTCLEQFL